MHDTELEELIESSRSRVQEVLDEYQDTKFWLVACIDVKKHGGQYIIYYIPNRGICIPDNTSILTFHLIKGAKRTLTAWYRGGNKIVDEYYTFLEEIADKINRATTLQRFCIKKYIEEHPDLTV